ncbi:hypothetical protein IKW73_00265 [Candidatus Saccharibacteria bacterium]|nr:hypothetical protein [Candidatus Saccharibacteria bacterium]
MESLFKLIVQDADIVVPDTGTYTTGGAANGDANLISIILASVCLTIIAGIIALRIIKRRKKSKEACAGIVAAIIAGLLVTAPAINTNALNKELDITVAETITATIDRGKGETYVVVPVDITLNEATPNGFNLYMYGGELTDGTNTISLVSADGSKITEGTWGVVIDADSEPAIDDEVWGQIGTASSPKMVLSGTDEVPAGATGRIYYGVAIDDDIPAGTYTTTIGFSVENYLGMTLEESYENSGAEKITVGSNSYYTMQGMTTEICENTTIVPDTLQVVDTRDNTIYTIGKLADNRCWLLDNLALDLLDPTVQSNISPSNTNADADSLTSLFSGNRANGNKYATAGIATWTSGYSYSVPMIYTASKDVTNPSDSIEEVRNSKFGIYYNYCAASAGNYCYGNDTSYGIGYDKPNTAIDTEYDICPSGWRMPTSYTYDATTRPDGGEYGAIITAYNDDVTNVRSALLLPSSGYFSFDNGSLYDWNGYFWASTMYDVASTFHLYFSSSSVDSMYIQNRYAGHSVRCIAK